MLDQFLQANQIALDQLALIVPQQLSNAFLTAVEQNVGGRRIYRRARHRCCNLLTSDCLVSLAEAVEREQVKPGDIVLLIPAGPLSSLGFVLLKREE